MGSVISDIKCPECNWETEHFYKLSQTEDGSLCANCICDMLKVKGIIDEVD